MVKFKTIKGYDSGFCLVGSFNRIMAERPAQWHLRLIAAALKTGGNDALDCHLSEYVDNDREHWTAARTNPMCIINLIEQTESKRRFGKELSTNENSDADQKCRDKSE